MLIKKLFYILGGIALVTLSSITNAAKIPSPPPANFTPAQVEQIQTITRDYLINNPQILIEMGKKLQEQQYTAQQEQLTKLKEAIPLYKKQIFDLKAPGRVVLGNPQGKIIVVEFTQHQCPHCKSAAVTIHKLIKDYPEIKLLVIYWPFFGDDAIYTAKAVSAAAMQNKAAELDHAFFTAKDLVTKEQADTLIKALPGLDTKKLYADMLTQTLSDGLTANYKLAKTLGLIGTPTFIVSNEALTKFSLVPGQLTQEELIKAINEVRS